MNIVDYILIGILALFAWKGFRNGLLPSLVNLVGLFLVFIIAFYLKQPMSVLLYENLPFFDFGGIFKGVIAINILLYELLAYVVTITLLVVILKIIRKVSIAINNLLSITLFMNLPSKIIGAALGVCEGLLYSFVILYLASLLSFSAPYVKDSKFSSKILKEIPVLNDITKDLTSAVTDIYNVVIENKNNTYVANIESIDVLMKHNILTYESANKLIEKKKIDILGIEEVVNKYKGDKQ